MFCGEVAESLKISRKPQLGSLLDRFCGMQIVKEKQSRDVAKKGRAPSKTIEKSIALLGAHNVAHASKRIRQSLTCTHL